jgi:hypothetical protein
VAGCGEPPDIVIGGLAPAGPAPERQRRQPALVMAGHYRQVLVTVL